MITNSGFHVTLLSVLFMFYTHQMISMM